MGMICGVVVDESGLDWVLCVGVCRCKCGGDDGGVEGRVLLRESCCVFQCMSGWLGGSNVH